jgi:hypothetical protein
VNRRPLDRDAIHDRAASLDAAKCASSSPANCQNRPWVVARGHNLRHSITGSWKTGTKVIVGPCDQEGIFINVIQCLQKLLTLVTGSGVYGTRLALVEIISGTNTVFYAPGLATPPLSLCDRSCPGRVLFCAGPLATADPIRCPGCRLAPWPKTPKDPERNPPDALVGAPGAIRP